MSGFDAEKALDDAWHGHVHAADEIAHDGGVRFVCRTCHDNSIEALQRAYAAGIEAAALYVQRDAEKFEHGINEGADREACRTLATHSRELLTQIRALLPKPEKEAGR